MTSDRYAGDAGATYYHDVQRDSGLRAGRLAVSKFEPYLGPRDRVIDVGCGGGFLLEALPGAAKVGIEPNGSPRTEAVERGLDVRPSLDHVEDGWADVVVSHHALEHLTDPLGTLAAVRRVLRPGGTIVVYVPLDDWRRFRRARADDPNGHLYSWAPQHLHNLLVESGFADVEVALHTHAWPPNAERLADRPALFEAACYLTAVVLRRREVSAVATNPT